MPNYKASSAGGDVVFFETEDQLVTGDTDTRRDVYERSFDVGVGAYVTRMLSLGPVGGNDAYHAQYEGASEDGTRVFFSTEERLTEGDTDRRTDVYMREVGAGATTTLVSAGGAGCAPACGNGALTATFAGTDLLGTEVLIETREQLDPADTDSSTDLYLRDLVAGETSLVSAGGAACAPACGNGAFDVSRRGLAGDGSHAYFTTAESLSDLDTDSAIDIYAHDLGGGVTSLVSRGDCAPACGNGGAVPIFNGSSADGLRVFFSTDEQLDDADTDTATDVYARDLPGGPTLLISDGSGDVTATFAAASAGGDHIFFTSAEGLAPGDADSANDVYEWTTEGLELVTPATCASACGATFDAVSEDATELLFTTAEKLSGLDNDSSDDIYRQQVGGGSPVLVSRGEAGCPSCWNTAADARFNEASADASRVVFTTSDGLLAEDEDGEDDIYLRDIEGDSSSLVTTSPSFCPLKKGNCGATFVGASQNGLHVYFRTVERFTLDDGDNEADIYERFLGASPSQEVTRLISTGNLPDLELGPEAPELTGTDPESGAGSLTPRVLGEAAAGAVKIYTSSDCSGEPLAAGTSAGLFDPGLQVPVESGSLTTFRATVEAEGFVSACSNAVSYLHLMESGGGEEEGGGGGGGDVPVAKKPPAPRLAPPSQSALVYLAPRTRITFAPASKTRSRSPVFRFTDSTGQQGTSFRCKLDRRAWKGCSSPLRLKRLGSGRHVLLVTAINAVGEAEAGAEKRVFKVVPR